MFTGFCLERRNISISSKWDLNLDEKKFYFLHISLPELPRMYLKVVNLIISQFKIDTLTTLNSLRTLVYKNIYAACYDTSIYVIL